VLGNYYTGRVVNGRIEPVEFTIQQTITGPLPAGCSVDCEVAVTADVVDVVSESNERDDAMVTLCLITPSRYGHSSWS
jgi:hypothetical protein